MDRKIVPKSFTTFITLAIIASTLWAFSPAYAVSPINTTWLGGVAVKGYDPVAYFVEGKPVKGSGKYEHKWMGAKWRFSSAENRELFAKNPEKYAPQYGGYCAYAVSQGAIADIDPTAWKIVNGKLYLNLNHAVARIWRKDIPGYIVKADKNWPAVLEK
jgi:YHS domain-containing protein